MAWSLKAINYTRTPITLKLSRDAYTSNPVRILEVFRSNLAKLYSPALDFDKMKADTLFTNINLPTLECEQHVLLESPITELEVQNAIKALKPRKRPGPYAFSPSYYKHFVPTLIPILTRALNSILNGHTFRTETLTSIITMIPKPRSDSTSWTNFHPISLLNLDIKLLTKILVNRLNPIIGQLIHRDQMVFMPTQQAGDIRHALLLNHASKKRRIPACLLSLNVRKAFDPVTWPYMQYILHKWGFGNNFLTWVSSLYDKTRAYVKYAGYKSAMIDIRY